MTEAKAGTATESTATESTATESTVTESTVTVTLKLFAVYQETVGASEQVLTVPVGSTAGDVRDRLIQAHPTLASWKDLTRFGINLQFAEATTVLNEGDELVLIPPVSGG